MPKSQPSNPTKSADATTPKDCVTQSCPETVPDTYGKAIKIEGNDEFRKKTIAALDEIKSTPSGKALLKSLDGSGKTVTIKSTSGGNQLRGFTSDAKVKSDGKAGKGSDSTVYFNPKRKKIGSKDWETRPPAIGLAHELIHANHAASGTIDTKQVKNDSRPDPTNPKKTATEKAEEVRTVGIAPYDKEPYSENKIRGEWDPKQPLRPWY